MAKKNYARVNYIDCNGEIIEREKLKKIRFKRLKTIKENVENTIATTVIIRNEGEQLEIEF